jgi:hypothetical protein
VIAWLMTNWVTQLVWVVFAAWFARGVWKATMRPRLTYVEHSEVTKGERATILTVKRIQRLPPWRTLKETWVLIGKFGYYDCAIRESDGLRVSTNNDVWGGVVQQLYGMREVLRVREAETEQLSAPERRPN